MVNYLIVGLIAIGLEIAIAIGLEVYNRVRYAKAIKLLQEAMHYHINSNRMDSYEIAEYIVHDLELKSKQRDLTELERKKYQQFRDSLYKLEKDLRAAGYAKKSSAS